jgi:hypothetical protein
MTEIDDAIVEISKYYALRKKKKNKGVDITLSSSEHKITYNSSTETLEPIYFWILDFMNDMFGGDIEKLIDNFASSPGSGHFSELQGKASQMQQEASRVLGTVSTMLRGVINLLYDLKEFKIRLSHYDQAKSKDKLKAEAGILALKQIWMDKVDIQRSAGSINAMASGNLQFVTLRDAFMMVKSEKDVDNLDLNDRVKRVLKPRIQEFNEWRKRSEEELRRRFEIEKTYLKSQVDGLKLNARWAKPYLKAAQQLATDPSLVGKPELVNVFNTVLLRLSIMGKKGLNLEQEIIDKNLPRDFKKLRGLRKYYSIVVVDFNFRGIPSRAGQQAHYVFGGKADVTFKSYSLNEDELMLLKEKLSESDLDDSLKLVQGMTDDSLLQLKLDIEEFSDEAKEEKTKSEDTNPFSALFSFAKRGNKIEIKEKNMKKQEEKLKQLKQKGVKGDRYAEKYMRNLAEANAINSCFTVFDIYKKAHGMASFPYAYDVEAKPPRTKAEEVFGLGKEK